MLLNGRIVFTLGMLTIFVTMVVVALGYPPASRFAPLVIGIPGIVLTLGQLVVDFYEQHRERSAGRSAFQAQPAPAVEAAAAAGNDVGRATLWRELSMFAYFFGLIAAIILFGFWLTIPVFMILFLRVHEQETWRFTLSLTAAGTAVLYLVFDRMLGIYLHEGFVTLAVLEWFGR